jgi:hypothetical protein
MRIFGAVVNRTQRLVLAIVVLTWSTVVAILLLSPEVYDGAAGYGHDAHRRLVDLGLLVVLTVPLGFLAVAVVRRWRWAFWLVLAAFFAGLLRVPAAALQLTGHLSMGDPAWYLRHQLMDRLVEGSRAAS